MTGIYDEADLPTVNGHTVAHVQIDDNWTGQTIYHHEHIHDVTTNRKGTLTVWVNTSNEFPLTDVTNVSETDTEYPNTDVNGTHINRVKVKNERTRSTILDLPTVDHIESRESHYLMIETSTEQEPVGVDDNYLLDVSTPQYDGQIDIRNTVSAALDTYGVTVVGPMTIEYSDGRVSVPIAGTLELDTVFDDQGTLLYVKHGVEIELAGMKNKKLLLDVNTSN